MFFYFLPVRFSFFAAVCFVLSFYFVPFVLQSDRICSSSAIVCCLVANVIFSSFALVRCAFLHHFTISFVRQSMFVRNLILLLRIIYFFLRWLLRIICTLRHLLCVSSALSLVRCLLLYFVSSCPSSAFVSSAFLLSSAPSLLCCLLPQPLCTTANYNNVYPPYPAFTRNYANWTPSGSTPEVHHIRRQTSSDSMSSLASMTSMSSVGSAATDSELCDKKKQKKKNWVRIWKDCNKMGNILMDKATIDIIFYLS